MVRSVPEFHKTISAIAINFCWPPELDDKILSLKQTNPLLTGYGQIKSILTRKLPPCWLVFLLLGRWRLLLEKTVNSRLTQPWILWATIMTSVARHAYGCNIVRECWLDWSYSRLVKTITSFWGLEYIGHGTSGRPCFDLVLSHFWLLQSFYTILHNGFIFNEKEIYYPLNYCQQTASGGKTVSLSVRLLVGWMCSSVWPNTHMNIGNTNWTLWVIEKNKRETQIWEKVGMWKMDIS